MRSTRSTTYVEIMKLMKECVALVTMLEAFRELDGEGQGA